MPERWPRWKTEYDIWRRWRSRRGSSLWPSSASWRGQRPRTLRRHPSTLVPWVPLEPWRCIWRHIGISRRSHDPTVFWVDIPCCHALALSPLPSYTPCISRSRAQFLTAMSALCSAVVQSRFNHHALNCSHKFVKAINSLVAHKITHTPQR